MAHITFDYSKVLDKFVAPHEVDNLQAQVTVADEMIRKGTGPGADFLGWRDPVAYTHLTLPTICSV